MSIPHFIMLRSVCQGIRLNMQYPYKKQKVMKGDRGSGNQGCAGRGDDENPRGGAKKTRKSTDLIDKSA